MAYMTESECLKGNKFCIKSCYGDSCGDCEMQAICCDTCAFPEKEDICPECGCRLIPNGGCWLCPSCGWNNCETTMKGGSNGKTGVTGKDGLLPDTAHHSRPYQK